MGGLVVITGGEGALGRATARAFADAGHPVHAPGRRELDVTDAAAARAFFEENPAELVVCNAGLARDAGLARLEEAAWDEVIAVNLRGAANCAAAAIPAMRRAGRGHLVFVSSYSALHPPRGQAAYAAAKAGLIGLAKSLARELGSDGIRVNTLLPGFLETPMTAGLTDERRGEIRGDHVLGRFNTPEVAAEFLVHLHDRLPHASGQVFQLDNRIA